MCLFNKGNEFSRRKRFATKTVEAGALEQPRPLLFIGGGRNDEKTILSLDCLPEPGKFVEELESVYARHVQIGKDDAGSCMLVIGKNDFLLQIVQGVFCRAKRPYLPVLYEAFDNLFCHGQGKWIIIDYQHTGLLPHR